MENRSELFGHPKGLYILFFTELWERFSYYGMRAILVFYIYSTYEDGGLGWKKSEAIELYGWYTMLVYVMSIPGGILADKLLGQKKTVMLGGILLCLGHGILAFEGIWAFYVGLGLIVLGVGGLKPNISTMVGGLYKAGDERRDKGFTIFYIGINVGAFLAAIIVGYVGENIGWHYGFGLAGIGMILGQAVYMYGQKFLVGIGDYVKPVKIDGGKKNQPLTRIEKDRVKVLLISFLIIIVFWGAFEQAGGLLNIYAKEKINRMVFGWEIPASWFQSVNAAFIIIFGTAVAAFWAKRKYKRKEVSSLYKMGFGTIIMGLGFLLMAGASKEAGTEAFGKAGIWWLVGAYFLHTIGELCASPVALSFITKLAPLKYASIMMGVYFAATGLGNKLAGSIGEAAQTEPINIDLTGDKNNVQEFITDSLIEKDMDFTIRGTIELDDQKNIILTSLDDNSSNANDLKQLISISDETRLASTIETASKEIEGGVLHATLRLEKDVEAKKIKANTGDGKNYSGKIEIEEVENQSQFKIFVFITGLTVVFGILIILFLKYLKRLTHGAEELEEPKEIEDRSHGELVEN